MVALSTGLLLQFLGCIIWNNYWPALVGLLYVLVPMPYLFFGSSSNGGYQDMSSSEGWQNAGKFLVGFTGIGSFAIPAILAHSGVITSGACIMEILASAILMGTVVMYDFDHNLDW